MTEQGLALSFTVLIDGSFDLGDWTKCEGLSVEYDVYEYKEGGLNGFVHRLPGRAKYTNVKLSRPVDVANAGILGWLASVQTAVTPSSAQICVYDTNGDVVATWVLSGVYPVKWSGPTLDVGSNSPAIETLEVAHTGFLGPR
jgi:phage tail-like protein